MTSGLRIVLKCLSPGIHRRLRSHRHKNIKRKYRFDHSWPPNSWMCILFWFVQTKPIHFGEQTNFPLSLLVLFIFHWVLGKNCDLIHAESSRRRLSCFDSFFRIFLHTYSAICLHVMMGDAGCYKIFIISKLDSELTLHILESLYRITIVWRECDALSRFIPDKSSVPSSEIFHQPGIFPCHQNFRSKEDNEKLRRVCKLNLHIYGSERRISIHC